MAQKIEIPVSLNAQIDNLKQIRSTLINTVNAAGKESTLAKTLTKDLSKVDEQIRELENISLQPTINESEFRHIQTIFDRLTKQFQSSFTQIDLSGFEQIASEADINRLKTLTQEASKYRKELEAIRKVGSSEKTEAFLTRTNRQQLLDQGRTLKGFDSTATLDKNATAMEKAAESYRRSAIELQDALDTLDQEATDASNRARTIKDRVDNLTAQHQTLRTDSRIADFHYRAASLETNFSANSQMSNPTVGSIRTGLRRTLETVYADGKIATDAREAVSDWIKKLAPNISTTEAARMVQQDLTTLLEDLMEEIFGAGYRADNDLLYNPNHSAMLSRAQGYSRAEINRLNRKHSTATVADIGTRTKEVQQQLKQEQAEYQKINNEINKKQAKWDELDEQQSSYLNAANEASKLSQELYTLAEAEKAAAEASKQAQIAQNKAEQKDLKNRVVSGVKGSAAPGPGQIQGLRGNLKGFGEDTEERYSSGNAAEEFKHNLQMSIRQWMSAQQIVNIIKDGLRQAIQDIQGLDKAMTNIAVVTDMSVGDLWGKINDYMAIAQQYGVTTQGVYEVSQLYYQQGLSTSEVMAATTETLKMARIAGMDYAEAADAMTVAIRAFKMEMSDAQTVTDVYSKVAAVTASDSEELAIAMSKTASSAESVGSSFENTTAMLAVMIETTRESAQNLGSALKSIISRYGEMKTGLTVDSEGEAIDYNKVDTALKSVGISIKDAQGQFRDFDDVIFELSEKWDTLDKNTQRYIATIMAGNRQQSRFIALVDNWERLDEVATAAQDSEDAGLLQYAKTLDSLETKINNIKTSFQEFYMSILNGPVFGAALEFINDLIKGLNKLSKFTTILNITSIISGFKVLGSILVNTFSTAFSQVSGGWKSMLENMTLSARTAGAKAGKQYQMGWSTGQSGTGKTLSSKATLGISALSLVGTGLTMAGTAVANKNQEAGTVLSSLGTGLQVGTMVGMINPIAGAITGALAAIVSGIASWPSELEKAQQNLDKAQEKAEEANIKRAQSKERYTNLRDTLKELERLKEIRFDSDANFDEWIKANEQALESYPELISTFDEANNAIVDLEAAEANLMQARMQAASAAREAADAQIAQALAQRATEQIEYTNTSEELNKLTGTIEYDDKHGIYAQYFTAAQIPAETAKELVNILHMTGEAPASLDQTIWAQQGRTAYGVLDPTSKDAWSLRTTNKQWAEAAKFLDMDTVAVSQWWALMAQITDGADFAQMLSKTFSSDYLKEEYSEKDLLALLTNNKYTSARELAAASPEASRELKQSDLAVDASLRSGINAYLDSYLLGLDSENTFLELGNAKQTMSLALIESFNEDFQTALADDQNLDVKEYWKNWTETKFVTLSTELEAALDELYKNLSIAGDIDEYNDLIKNASSYNKDEYTTALGDLGLEVSAGIGKILVDQFTEKATKASEDFKAALENIDADTDTDLNFETALAGSGVSIPQAYTDEVAEYARRLQKQVSSGLMSDSDANAYFARYLSVWKEILATNDLALRDLFAGTDFQSLESVASLITSLSEKNLLGNKEGQISQQTLENLIPQSLVNLNTSYSSLISNLAKDIDAKAAQINKAQSGFDTLADTQQFAEDMGLTLDDFTFDNGKWYVEATTESIAKIKAKTSEVLEKQKELVKNTFDEQIKLIETNAQLKDLSGKNASENADQILTAITQDTGKILPEEVQSVFKANWSNYVDWIAANTDKADTTFAQYLRNTYEATLSALDQEQIDYFDWLEKEWAYSESIRNRVGELSGDETAQRKQKAWDTIASKGTEGYSAQDIAEIETALGVKDLGIKQADGTFDLDTASKTLKSLDLPQYVWNAINASVETNIKSAEEGLQKLGETVATGEKLTPVEIRGLLGDQFKGISDAGAKIIYDSFMGYLSGSVDEKTLLKELSAMHRILDPTLSYEDSLIKAKETFEEIYPEISVAADENIENLLELKGKAIRGELTHAERETLIKAKSVGPDAAQDLEENLDEALIEYANDYISNTKYTFDKRVAGVKTALTPKFEEAFGEDIGKLGQTAVQGTFDSQDAALDFMSKFYVAMGANLEEIDLNVEDWFTRDSSGQYRLDKTISELRAQLIAAKTEENEEEIENLENQLKYYEDLQKLQRKESLTSSFSSMATAEEIRASELMKLYGDQGKTLGSQAAEILSDQLNALDPLKRFEELTKIFGDLGEIDTETYTRAINATKTSIQATSNSIKSAAENLGSKIITGNDELSDYISVFGEETPEFLLNYYSDAIKSVLKGEDRYGLFETQIKQAIGRTHPGMTEEEIQKAYDALLNSADDASYELVDTVFNAKIEALESGHLSAASKEILKSDNQGAWIDTFNAIIGKAADERAKLIFEEKAKAYNEYLAAERITEAEHLEGIAQSATDYFASLSDSIDAANQAYYAEAAEAIASGDRAYSRDELGKLYASAWKRGKVTDPDVFATEYVKSWNKAGEAILDIKKLKEANIITSRQVAEFSENLTNNVFSAAEDVINKMSSGLKVDNYEVQAIFDELGMSLKDADAEAIINGGLNTLLNILQVELMTAGADSSDIQEKIKELQITIIDMITEALTSGFSALAEGIEGTLSEASYNELQKMYGLSNSSMRTSKGVQLSQSDQQALIRGLYGKAAASGKTAGFGEELWKTLSESEDSTIKGYKDIQEEIDTITEKIGENAAATDEYVQALEAARDAAMQAADAAEFAFMEQDATSGLTQNFDKYVGSIEKVQTAFKTLSSKGYIDYQEFYNMMDFLNNSGQWETFSAKVGLAGKDYETFVNSVVANTDKWGQVNIGGITADMSVSVDAAMTAMGESMAEGLKEVANQQIKYLTGLETMLQAMAALESIGDIDLSLNFLDDLKGIDGKPVIIEHLSQIYDNWHKLSAESKREVKAEVELKLKNVSKEEGMKSFMEAFGLGGQDFFAAFFGESFGDQDVEIQFADAFGSLVQNIPNLTKGQMTTIATQLKQSFNEELFDEKGLFIGSADQLMAGFINFFKEGLDYSAIPETITPEIIEAIGNMRLGEIKVTGGTISLKDGGLVFNGSAESFEKNKEQIIKELETELNRDIDDITLGKNNQLEIFGPEIKTETENLTIDFNSLEEAAAGVAEQTNFLQQTIATFEVSEGFREFVGLLNQITGGTQIAAETVEGAAQLANLGKEINAEGEGKGLQLKVDISEALTAFDELKAQFAILVEALSTPITIDINSVGTITAGAPAVQMQSGDTQGNDANTGVNSITTHTVQILWEVTDPDFDSIEDPTLGFNWKKPAPPVPAPAKTPTISFYWASNSTAPKYTGKPVEIPTVLKPPTSGGTSGGNSGNGGVQQIIKEWTGTINNISGAAFADGSIGRLYSGAQFANKTLVGELGPELAVYNGEYHLLGQSGAEFVRLPNNAIVFNHKQTEGIVNGQANIRGKAMADGNVSGPALAGGSAASALAAVQRAKAVWQGLLNSLSVADLLGGGQGGGGGNTLKGVKEELQEWYNLSRQIADIEQEINNLIAERQNIAKKDGDAYLRSLRKEQELLERQAATQEILLGYQQLQLERQAEQINTNKIWSQFLEVDESGLLQYIKGNELNGGKGALEVLSELNEMSGEEQLKFLNNLGYTAVNQDGEKLEGQELIQKFFEELQLQIDEYDALYDTVHETEETLENLQYKVEEINNQIIENQMDLEQDIFDILVDAWEEEIEALEEQKDLIEEANDAYIKGLNEALSAEREMYSEEQSIADREQLQRQLSLLRRSGGSASQIADLEQQLDSMLKDEYFRNQEQVIERIEDANEEQIRQLERQIKLQEEALEFEKEHGILWTKVYDIMAGSADQILNFMQGNSPEFFSQSLLQQEKMLTDWAKKIGIYTENKKYEGYEQDIQQSAWDSGDIWSYGAMSGYKSTYDSMTAEQQAAARKMFNTTYANARLSGDDHNTAMAKAQNALINNFKSYKEQQAASGNKPETDLNTGSGSETWYVTGPNKLNLRDQPSKSGNRLAQLPAGTKVKVLKKLDSGWFQVEVDGKTGYVDSQFLSKGTSGSNSNESSSNSGASNSSSSGYRYKVTYSGTMSDGETDKTVSGSGMGNSEYEAKAVAERYAAAKVTGNWKWLNGGPTYKTIKLYSEGGLVDYTGPAIVHGTRSKPEAFLNAKQTAMISEAVKFAGDGGALDGIKATLNALNASIKSIVNNNRNEISSFTVAPGAVTIQVAELSDSYDVEELSRDVMNRMVAIASKSTNRGVNRR